MLQEAFELASSTALPSDREGIDRDYAYKVAYNLRQREMALAELAKLKEARSSLEVPVEVEEEVVEIS
ncbi:hypothetical protein GALMADRAFT_143915 [Galerina marginata CBS 339.88]|uniref:Uncharacterized protein n=1 Tax=Galerina marginata (strain CBS 339.88) TaxID=685588 RepID=A0A067SIA1_GALM3|nr:hypothetical protein GALMADRAFT_144538 [Galerina marginata CBS 339.88]KDR71203.1 hypothetical protein GALMADRAFT_143915 [Galerina marginata CBS 339.88]